MGNHNGGVGDVAKFSQGCQIKSDPKEVLTNVEWIICPTCTNKTKTKIREDTILRNFPLFCAKCKQETLIDVTKFIITVIKEPDA